MKKPILYFFLFALLILGGTKNSKAQGLFYMDNVVPSVTQTDSCSGLSITVTAYMGCINFQVTPASYSIANNIITIDFNCTSSIICAGAISYPSSTVVIPSLPAGNYSINGDAYMDRNYVNTFSGGALTVVGCTATGISENSLESIQIGPNPANEYLNFSGLAKNQNYQYEIVDIKGSQVQTAGLTNAQVNLPEMTPGLYFVRVFTETESIIKRIVIQ